MSHARLGTGEIVSELLRVSARPGVRTAVCVSALFAVTDHRPGAAALITGSAHAYLRNTNAYLGALDPQPIVLGFPRGQPHLDQPEELTRLTAELVLPLDAPAIMTLEDLRQGAEFTIRVDVDMLIVREGTSPAGTPDGPVTPVSPPPHPLARPDLGLA